MAKDNTNKQTNKHTHTYRQQVNKSIEFFGIYSVYILMLLNKVLHFNRRNNLSKDFALASIKSSVNVWGILSTSNRCF